MSQSSAHSILARAWKSPGSASTRCLGYKAHKKPLGKAVGNLYAGRRRKIALQDVDHHIGDAYRCLISIEGKCHLRIHYRKARLEYAVGAQAQFLAGFGSGNHSVARALATGAGNGKNHAYGQRLGPLGFTGKEIPKSPL